MNIFNCFEENNFSLEVCTMPAPMPQQAATAKMLNTAEPTIVPIPILGKYIF